MRPLLLTLLSLAACAHVNSGQPFEHPPVPGALLGSGFSSLAGHTTGKCVVPRPVETVRDRVDQLAEEVIYVHNKQELLSAIGYSGGLNFGIFGVGVNASLESIDRQINSRSRSFLLVQIRIVTASKALGKYQLEKHAAETLRRDGPGKFYETCGDGFVAEHQQGGYFLGIIELKGVSREDANKLSGSAGASFLGIGVQGGTSRESRRFFEEHSARYFVLQEGGAADGATSLRGEQSVDALLQRARRFQQTVAGGRAVTTRLVIMPYQVTSNRPRRADPWDLTPQRRFLAQLATYYGHWQQAEDELKVRLGAATCARARDQGKLEKLYAQYLRSLAEIKQRVEDCMRDPSRECSGERRFVFDAEYHHKVMQLCPQEDMPHGLVGTGRPMAAPQPAPAQLRPGVDAPCRLWRFSSVVVRVAPSKPGGAPWDADGSPPETAFTLWLGERAIGFPTRSSYTNGGAIENGVVSAGAPMRASLVDRDAFFDDRIASIAEVVPETLEQGAWTLQSGRTSVSLRGRCVE